MPWAVKAIGNETDVNRTFRSAAVLLAAALLGSCSSDTQNVAAPAASGVGAASAAASPASSIVNEPESRKDVALTSCARSGDGWSAAGKVTNAQKDAASYTIVISFTDKHSTVLARQSAKVEVAAGGSQDWKVQAGVKAQADVVCVLRGVDRA